MFTGLITDIGLIQGIKGNRGGKTFTIRTSYDTNDLVLGESIACHGACLTVTRMGEGVFDVDASPETLACTILGDITVGSKLHLERALRVGDRLGGHYVTGHVDGIGVISKKCMLDNAWVFEFEAPTVLAPLLVPKGSITVNGVSLTINHVEDIAPNGVKFQVAIIPFTYGETCFKDYRVGQKVNLEGDIIGKYIQRMESFAGFRRYDDLSKDMEGRQKITMDKLKAFGFE